MPAQEALPAPDVASFKGDMLVDTADQLRILVAGELESVRPKLHEESLQSTALVQTGERSEGGAAACDLVKSTRRI